MNSKRGQPTTSAQPSASPTEADLSRMDEQLQVLSELVVSGALAPYMIPLGMIRRTFPPYDLFTAPSDALISMNFRRKKRRKRRLFPAAEAK